MPAQSIEASIHIWGAVMRRQVGFQLKCTHQHNLAQHSDKQQDSAPGQLQTGLPQLVLWLLQLRSVVMRLLIHAAECCQEDACSVFQLQSCSDCYVTP
jgi:hypothetical protein